MRTAHVLAFAVAMAGSALLSLPASAERICNQDCVGPLCNKRCVDRGHDVTVIHRNGHSACSVNRLTHPAAWMASWWG